MLRQCVRVLGRNAQNAAVRPSAAVQAGRGFANAIPPEHSDKFDAENPNFTKFEVVNDPEVWKYVEKLIPSRRIPACPNVEGPSGWKPTTLTREQVCDAILTYSYLLFFFFIKIRSFDVYIHFSKTSLFLH